MSAATAFQFDITPDASPAGAPSAPQLSPELAEAIIEIAESERSLDDVLVRAQRLHEANIQHDPRSCLVCFGGR
ncbi:hypothetical protein ACFQ3F_17395 [Nocardioides ginsengisoli]|uniref:Uncharacterized protein n=1 Tax=Nocardioides ginsengisoli TaxID=363868 RepID=A0ABW3W3A8_9ACTN